jgi:transcription termination/antitermination protein NusG
MDERANMQWYALYVRSRHEKKSHQLLLERGIESFLPLLETVRQWSDRKKRISEPLFRGYVFVNIDYQRQHVGVLENEGVVRFIGIGKIPSVIAAREIEWLKRLVLEPDAVRRTVVSIPSGKRVRVMAGPFRDLEGVVLKVGRDDRLVVFFDSIMQGVEVAIRPDFLQPFNSKSPSVESDKLQASKMKHLIHP